VKSNDSDPIVFFSNHHEPQLETAAACDFASGGQLIGAIVEGLDIQGVAIEDKK
jgi:hypothetical protein